MTRSRRDPSDKVSWYCSYLHQRKVCWPVRVLRTDEYGWHYVVGLAGRMKGRSFSVVRNEIYSYVPTGFNLAPGARAFVRPEGTEARKAQLIRNRIAKLSYEGEQSNKHLKTAERLYREIDALARTLYPRTTDDRVWRYYDEDKEKARENITDKRATPALRNLIQMIDSIRAAAEREKT